MDIMQFIYMLCLTVPAALGYGLWSFFTSFKDPKDFQSQRIIATVIFSIIIGFILALSGIDPTNLTTEQLAALFATYTGVLFYVNKGIDAVWEWKFGKKVLEQPPSA